MNDIYRNSLFLAQRDAAERDRATAAASEFNLAHRLQAARAAKANARVYRVEIELPGGSIRFASFAANHDEALANARKFANSKPRTARYSTLAIADARVERLAARKLRASDDEPLTLTASSEAPIDNAGMVEVLSHAPGAVRLERINGGTAPLLFNHSWGEPVGMVTSGRIAGGKLHVTAKTFATDRAREVRSMIDGGLRNVSVGYQVHEVEQDRKTGTYTVTAWTPYEISIVTIPADPTVGVT